MALSGGILWNCEDNDKTSLWKPRFITDDGSVSQQLGSHCTKYSSCYVALVAKFYDKTRVFVQVIYQKLSGFLTWPGVWTPGEGEEIRVCAVI